MSRLCVSCEPGDRVVARSQDKHRFPAHHGCVNDVPPGAGTTPPPDPDPTRTHVLPPDRDPAAGRQRFTDRAWSLRSVIAVALASVILGGLGGAALASAGDDDHERGRHFERGGPVPPGMQRFHDRRKELKEFRQHRGGQPWWAPDGPRGSEAPSPTKPTPSG